KKRPATRSFVGLRGMDWVLLDGALGVLGASLPMRLGPRQLASQGLVGGRVIPAAGIGRRVGLLLKRVGPEERARSRSTALHDRDGAFLDDATQRGNRQRRELREFFDRQVARKRGARTTIPGIVAKIEIDFRVRVWHSQLRSRGHLRPANSRWV